jgi:hypothetical protein
MHYAPNHNLFCLGAVLLNHALGCSPPTLLAVLGGEVVMAEEETVDNVRSALLSQVLDKALSLANGSSSLHKFLVLLSQVKPREFKA